MIKAVAIDDEPPALKIVESFCARVECIALEKTFTQPNTALKYLKNFPINLLFLDISMPSMSGIDFAKKLEQNTMVIFTTAYSEYAVEGFNLNAVDYLLKPFTFDRFLQAVNKANEQFNYTQYAPTTEPPHIFIRADYSLIKIMLADIVLIEGLDDYLKIHLDNQKNIVARMTMKGILEKLPTTEFVRVHRSFIVPINRIDSLRNKMITIAQRDIPIGNSHEKDFFKIFEIT
ncbi:MAG: LytTR family DNA-binding domain-containing protein [Saprospiraceae bacterium]|nr:LytTR family DNA-binding domain-containing protein [Saprospiraceae bacterium]